MNGAAQQLLQQTAKTCSSARSYSPLALAYIGDGVYEIFVRSYVLAKGNAPVNKLHKASRELVKAQSQANLYRIIEPLLTEEEMGVMKRGRNAKSISSPKNGDIRDYRYATGLEALIGYLYIDQKIERIQELIDIGFTALNEDKQ